MVYHVDNPDFNFCMDVPQAINPGLYQGFARDAIAFAYPTHTVFAVPGAGGSGATATATREQHHDNRSAYQ